MGIDHAAATSACDDGNRRRLSKPPSHYNIALESPQSAAFLAYAAPAEWLPRPATNVGDQGGCADSAFRTGGAKTEICDELRMAQSSSRAERRPGVLSERGRNRAEDAVECRRQQAESDGDRYRDHHNNEGIFDKALPLAGRVLWRQIGAGARFRVFPLSSHDALLPTHSTQELND